MANPGEMTQKLPPAVGLKNFFSTRRGTVTLAMLAALAALGVLLMFMSNYKASVQAGASDIRVLVADQTIDKGTSGAVIAEAELFKPVTITEDEAIEGAVTDPSEIAGKVLSEPVYEGQQLSAAAFSAGADPIVGQLEGTQRAISVPVDVARGNVGQVEPGTHVDVLGSRDITLEGGRAVPTVDILGRDVLVLKVIEDTENSGAEEQQAVVLRLSDQEASRVAYGADAGDIWLTIRPPTLGEDSQIKSVRPEDAGISLLGGR